MENCVIEKKRTTALLKYKLVNLVSILLKFFSIANEGFG